MNAYINDMTSSQGFIHMYEYSKKTFDYLIGREDLQNPTQVAINILTLLTFYYIIQYYTLLRVSRKIVGEKISLDEGYDRIQKIDTIFDSAGVLYILAIMLTPYLLYLKYF